MYLLFFLCHTFQLSKNSSTHYSMKNMSNLSNSMNQHAGFDNDAWVSSFEEPGFETLADMFHGFDKVTNIVVVCLNAQPALMFFVVCTRS